MTGEAVLADGPLHATANQGRAGLAGAARPAELRDIGAGICPYEMLLLAAQRSDVIVVNYHHIFDEDIKESGTWIAWGSNRLMRCS